MAASRTAYRTRVAISVRTDSHPVMKDITNTNTARRDVAKTAFRAWLLGSQALTRGYSAGSLLDIHPQA